MKPRYAALGITVSLLAAFPVHAQWQPVQRLTRNGAVSQTSINFARSIAADSAGRVHIVWVDERDGNREIYYKRSIDGGLSWGPATRLTENLAQSNNPSIAVARDRVHVVWWDTRTGVHQIHYTHSPDGGLTWQGDRRIVDSPGGSAHPSVAVSASNVHVVYVDGRDGQGEVYYFQSLDNGVTWGPEYRLSALPHNSYTPTVAAWESNVYAAWTDTRHGGSPSSLEEEYFRRSTDNGETWDDEVRLTDDPANSWAPSLAAFGAYVWITWFDERDGNWEIYTKRSTDFGVTWSDDRRLTFDPGASQRPSLARHGSSLHIVWWDTRDGNNEIYTMHSPNLGDTWGPSGRLTQNPGSSVLASAAAAPSGVHAVWQDDTDGNSEINYARLPADPVTVGNGLIVFNGMVGGEPQLFTVAPDGSEERQLTSQGRNLFPAWSRDGSKILFTSSRTGTEELWIMDADGSNQTRLAVGTVGSSFVPDWSHDGTRVAYASVQDGVGHPEVWVMNVDGTEQHRLTFTPTNPDGPTWSLHPTWSPDGERIYYASTASGSTQIWGMFANGLGQEQKTRGLGPGFPDANVPEFSRDGALVFWAGMEQQFGEVWVWPMAPGGEGWVRVQTGHILYRMDRAHGLHMAEYRPGGGRCRGRRPR